MDMISQGLMYFIISLIIMIVFIFMIKKMEKREKKQQEQGTTASGMVLEPKRVEPDIEEKLNNIKKKLL